MAYLVEESSSQLFSPFFKWAGDPRPYDPYLSDACALSPDDVPKQAILQSRHKKLLDLFLCNSYPTVCEIFRKMVEELEPGVHQFFPIEFVTKKGAPVPGNGPYYLFRVMQSFDAILVAKSNLVWVNRYDKFVPGKTPLVQAPVSLRFGPGALQLVMSRPQIAGRHAWRTNQVIMDDLYFSDDLVDAVRAAKLKKFEFTHVEECDEAWQPEGNITPE